MFRRMKEGLGSGMRKSAIFMALAVLVTQAARADDLVFRPADILDAATGDFNRDGVDDLALLAADPDSSRDAGVYVYFRDPDRGILDLALAVPDRIWGGRDFYGQEPSISARANGSLAITTQNFAIGRNRWEHTLAVAYRDGRFVVAGLTFHSFDALQEDDELTCDLNLLTGKGIVNGRDVSFQPLDLTLVDWRNDGGDDRGTAICREAA